MLHQHFASRIHPSRNPTVTDDNPQPTRRDEPPQSYRALQLRLPAGFSNEARAFKRKTEGGTRRKGTLHQNGRQNAPRPLRAQKRPLLQHCRRPRQVNPSRIKLSARTTGSAVRAWAKNTARIRKSEGGTTGLKREQGVDRDTEQQEIAALSRSSAPTTPSPRKTRTTARASCTRT